MHLPEPDGTINFTPQHNTNVSVSCRRVISGKICLMKMVISIDCIGDSQVWGGGVHRDSSVGSPETEDGAV